MKKSYLIAILLLLSCALGAQNLSESFEGDNFPPEGWTIINQGSDFTWTRDLGSPLKGKASAFLSLKDSNNDDWLISPCLEVELNDAFSFSAKQKGWSSEKINVLLSVTGNQKENFSVVLDAETSVSRYYKEKSYSLDKYAGKKVYIAIQSVSKNSYSGVYIDEVKGPKIHIPEEAPKAASVVFPADKSDNNINNVILKWSEVSYATGYKLSYGTNADANNIVLEKSITDINTYQLPKLNYSTKYYWKVIAINTYGNSVDNTVWSFTTMDDPTIKQFPYKQGFENADIASLGWSIVDNNNDSKSWAIKRATYGSHSGMQCMSQEYAAKSDDLLISPPILAVDKLQFEFYIQGSNYSIQELRLKVSTSGTDYSDFDTDLLVYKEETGKYKLMSADLSAYKGKTIHIALHSINKSSVSIDDVRMYLSKDMENLSSACWQDAKKEVAIGDKQVEIMKFSISTQGKTNALSLNNISFNSLGTTNSSDIVNAKIYAADKKGLLDLNNLYGETKSGFDGEFVVSGDKQLIEGENIFYLCYDVSASAKQDNTLDASFVNYSLSNIKYNVTNSQAESDIVIKRIYNLQSGENTYTVNNLVQFYDDGGKDANYSENFSGFVSFIPSNASKKIELSFSKFDIFNSSSTGRNDVFKIYQGTEQNEDKLIGVFSDLPDTFKSTDPSGALSISFKVNTGMPKSGWISQVREYEPANMVYKSASIHGVSSNTILAGEKSVSILKVEIINSNTLNPLSVSKFNLALAKSSLAADISNVKMFYTAGTDEFSADNMFGSIDNPKSEYEITGSQSLIDGKNYFWLTYDISTTAKDDNVIDASCLSFVVSGTTETISDSSIKNSRHIKNVYAMLTKGTDKKTVYSPFVFTSDDKGFSGKYTPTAFCVLTFIPAKSNYKVKIEFDEFRLMISNNYGVKAEFEIFNGDKALKANSLYKATHEDNLTGPSAAIVSSASNGCLTIRFRANARSSSQAEKGWKARVSSILPLDMEYKSCAISQEKKDIRAGSVNQQILSCVLTTSGMLKPISNIQLNFNAEGTSLLSDITNAKLYYTGSDDVFSADKQIGTDIVDLKNNFSFICDEVLSEGENHFWLTYDISNNAVVDNIVDAQLVSVKAAGKINAIAKPNTDGYRTIKKIYILNADKDKITVNHDATLFFDEGGISGTYQKEVTQSVSFFPADKNDKVRLDLSLLELGSYARSVSLSIYNGASASPRNIIANLSADDNIKPSDSSYIYKSTSDDGSITVKFNTSKYCDLTAGWEAKVYSFTPAKVFVNSATQINRDDSDVLISQSDVEILRLCLLSKGDKDKAVVNKIGFNGDSTSDMSDINSVSLYYSKDADLRNLDSAHKFGQTIINPSADFVFSGNLDIDTEGNNYLFLLYNISSKAKVGNKISAKCTSVTADAKSVNISAKASFKGRVITAGVHGNFTIGKQGDYKTFATAISALSKGVDGAVVFSVESGTYTEQLKMPAIKGTSKQNTIIFESASGNADDVIITYNKMGDTSYGSTKYGLVNIEGADFVSFKNISFVSDNKNLEALVLIRNASTNLRFVGNKFTAPYCSGLAEISCIVSESSREKFNNNDNLYFENNIISGGYHGLNLSGVGYVGYVREKNHIVKNNNLSNQGSKGIYLSCIDDAIVEGNHIENKSSSEHNFSAIELYRPKGNLVVKNNLVSLSNDASGCVAINLREAKGSVDNHLKIYNNVISMSAKASGSQAFFVGKSAYIDIYHNSVYMYGKAKSKASVYIRSVITKLNFTNNIFVNKTGPIYISQYSGDLSKCKFTNNNAYTSSAYIALEKNSKYTDLQSWLSNSNVSLSLSEDVEFYSNTDLHLKSDKGLMSTTILLDEDCEGIKRKLPKCKIGAYEYQVASTTAPAFSDKFPKLISLTNKSAKFAALLNKNGLIYYAVQLKTDDMPSVEQIKLGLNSKSENYADKMFAKLAFVKNVEFTLYVNDLLSNTDYSLLLYVEDNLSNGIDKAKTIDFKTDFADTKLSDFESVLISDNNFTDGTSLFNNFEITKGDGIRSSAKYAKIVASTTANVEILNTSNGLLVDGMFFKSESDIKIYTKSAGKDKALDVPASDKWVFVNLRSLGKSKTIYIQAGKSDVFIDDFSGSPLNLSVSINDEYSIQKGDNLDIQAVVSGGVAPYSYIWKGIDSDNSKITVSPISTKKYSIEISDSYGDKLTKEFLVNVKSSVSTMANFEEILLSDESYIMGDDSNSSSSFYSGSYKFNNFYAPAYITWSGFAISNETSSVFETDKFLVHQFRNKAHGGLNGEGNYALVYAYGFVPEIELNNGLDQDNLKGMYITNNAFAVSSMTNGDMIAGDAFKQGDWYKLTISAYDKNNKFTKSMDVYLADYRSENKEDHFIIDQWKWIDLSSLGKAKTVKFSVSGSRNNDKGLLTPGYFCLDNFNSEKIDQKPWVKNPVKDIVVVENSMPISIDVNKMFTDTDNKDKDIKLEIISEKDNSIFTSQLVDGILSVSFENKIPGSKNISIQATSNGKAAIANINVIVNGDVSYVDAGIDNVSLLTNFDDTSIKLSELFANADSKASGYSIVHSSNKDLVNLSISENSLLIASNKDITGYTQLTINAKVNGKFVNTTFIINVSNADKYLFVNNIINDIVVDEDTDIASINISNIFKYVGDTDNVISIKSISHENEELMTFTLKDNNLKLLLNESNFGEDKFTIIASCNNQTETISFNVKVNAVDDAPILYKKIETIKLPMNSDAYKLLLSDYVMDVDNNYFECTVLDNTNADLIQIDSDNGVLSIKCSNGKFGTASIKMQIKSGSKTLDLAFDIIVDNILSVETISNDYVSIYPNPCEDVLHLDMNNYTGDLVLCIYSISGRLLLTKKINYHGIISLNVSSLPVGYYMINIIAPTGKLTRRFVKV